MVKFVKHDLEFIIEQISISEQHAALSQGLTLEESREVLLGLLPNSQIFFGMRTVDGSLNNLVAGQEDFGAADQAGGGNTVEFPRLVREHYRGEDHNEVPFPLGPGPFPPPVTNTDYQVSGDVVDSDPRIISNLIVDQTANNFAAVDAAIDNGGAEIISSPGLDGIFGTADDVDVYHIPNVAPDFGLTAPFNGFMTFFGQFFDHGLDLINKGGNGTVYIPLQPDDPLFNPAPGAPNFMVVTRASVDPGADGLLGTADDVNGPVNAITPFVDQNQTYTSHSSVQVFVREYELNTDGEPVATGSLLEGAAGGMSTWADVKAQARDILGIELDDLDVLNMPLLATDQYGNFIPGGDGFPQIVTAGGLVEGDLGTPVDASDAIRTGNNLLLDIAHNAAPVTNGAGDLVPDADGVAGNAVANDGMGHNTEYDDELLDAHFIAGDGRVNENIVLTSVHHVFHSEHNRLVEHTKAVLLGIDASQDAAIVASQDADIINTPLALLNEYLLEPVLTMPVTPMEINDLVWNGERLFQTAKFGTEMQYQHLVFEEFARKVQPLINVFGSYDTTIDPSITMEFSQAVYRFGHSMLTETVDRFDVNFDVIGQGGAINPDEQIGLINAFLNPLEKARTDDIAGAANLDPNISDADAGAGAIIRGMTRVIGNEIDEFVTEALRNNLVGLPLDLAAINIARGRDVGIPTLQEVRAEFFRGTSDPKLKPYDSWVDFAQNVKHEMSVVNFIAAYGTHDFITSQTTLENKREAAFALVTGAPAIFADDPSTMAFDESTQDGTAPADRLDFLNSTGAWANDGALDKDLDGVSSTGLGNIDLWIGGLAEQIEFFGGMLGSTFAFVFENQLESLQDGDRFYYLARTVGLNFLTQLEQNSFAELIQRNTDATHLPGDVFSAPDFILEVDQTKQATGLDEAGVDGIQGTGDDVIGADGIAGNSDPMGNSIFFPLVERDDPNQNLANIADEHYLKYQRTGGANGIAQHVVVGGTEFNDTIFTSTEDDTLWGDDGDDYLNSGVGADVIFGGTGDDILITLGGPGPSNLQGQDGNDVISAGPGEALILAGAGKDFVLAGADIKETFGGAGNDFIDAGDDANIVFAGEGDDWIESGNGNDLLQGDNGNPFQTSTVIGNDVTISNGGDNDHDMESGDDIMVDGAGTDRFEGMLGFDWVTHKDNSQGIEADMLLRAVFEAPLPPSNQAILDRYDLVEGLSGSGFADILRADNANAMTIATGENGLDNILRNFDLIDGLRGGDNSFNLFDNSVTEWGAGNIILGGDGSDHIEGRGGDDIIDGDLWLNVRISIRVSEDPGSAEMATVDGMRGVVEAGPGVPAEWVGRQLNDMMLDRTINPGQLHIAREILDSKDTHNTNVNGNEGDFDTAVFSGNIADYTIEGGGIDNGVDGIAGDGFISVTHTPPAGLGDGTDLLRNIERLQFADASVDLVGGLNSGPVGNLEIVGTVEVGEALSVNADMVTDPDNNGGAGGPVTGPISYIWQVEQTPGEGDFIDLINEQGVLGEPVPVAGPTFLVTEDVAGLALRVRGVYQDDNGVLETVFSDPTDAVDGAPGGGVTVATNGPDILIGTAAGETIEGLGGDDEIFGLGGDDLLIGGDDATVPNAPSLVPDPAVSNNAGNDILDGGAGTDTARFFGNLADFEFLLDIDGNLEVVEIASGEEDLILNIEFLEFDDQTIPFATAFASAGGGATPGDDAHLHGTPLDDTIDGLAGNDLIHGHGGNDDLIGGLGMDEIRGGQGDDTIDGGEGDDDLFGNAGADDIIGGLGNDTISGGGNPDTIDGGEGNDIISGNGGGDDIIGGPGIDFIDAGGGADTISGGLGDDDIFAGAGADRIFWEATDTTEDGWDIVDGEGGTDQIRITGSDADETFYVETFAEFPFPEDLDFRTPEIIISRDDGNTGFSDIIVELDNVEEIRIDGKGGNNTFIVAGDFTSTSLNLNTIILDGSSGDNTYDISGLTSEHRIIINTMGGDDEVVGDLRPQDIVILAPDTEAGDYSSTDNGDGTTTLSDGTNSITFSTLSTPLIEDGPQSNPSTNRIPLVAASVVLAALVQDTQLTITAAELLGTMGEITDPDGDPLTVQNVQASSGSITDNGDGTWTFTPDAGDDTEVNFTYDVTDGLSAPVSAMADLDLLPNSGTPQPNAHPGGTAGDDILLGKPGDDIIDAQGGNDRVFAGEGNDIVFGGDGADQLFGEAGNDIIFGGQGDDSLFGGAGKDILFGDEGDDIIIGGLGNDVLLGGTGADTILGDVGNDIILGGSGNDLLMGQDGNDIVDGGSGEDQIHGGAGRDLLLGGQDNDTFVFNTIAEAGNGALADVIADFQVGDKIDLSSIDANLGTGGNQGFDPIMFDATFTDAGQIMFRHEQRSDGVHTILEGNVDGDNAADFRIDIVGQHNLTSSDFLGVA